MLDSDALAKHFNGKSENFSHNPNAYKSEIEPKPLPRRQIVALSLLIVEFDRERGKNEEHEDNLNEFMEFITRSHLTFRSLYFQL